MAKTVRRIATRSSSVAGKVSAKRKPPVSDKKRPANDAAKPDKKKKTGSGKGFMRGADGFAKARDKRESQEREYQKRKDTPYVFRLQPGEEAELILLDKEPPFFVALHKVKAPNGRWVDEVCIADSGQTCPLCEKDGKEGSFTCVMTVLDRRPYKIKNGPNAGKTIKVSKKLLFIRGRNLPKFDRAYKGKAKGNFRGMKLVCRRDGDKESAMGEDIEFGGRVSEDFLKKFGETAQASDYEKIFELPSASELRKRYNIKKGAVAGGEEFDEDDDDDNYDGGDVGWDSDDDDDE